MKEKIYCRLDDDLSDPSLVNALLALMSVPFEKMATAIKKLFQKQEEEKYDSENEEACPSPLALAFGWMVVIILSPFRKRKRAP